MGIDELPDVVADVAKQRILFPDLIGSINILLIRILPGRLLLADVIGPPIWSRLEALPYPVLEDHIAEANREQLSSLDDVTGGIAERQVGIPPRQRAIERHHVGIVFPNDVFFDADHDLNRK